MAYMQYINHDQTPCHLYICTPCSQVLIQREEANPEDAGWDPLRRLLVFSWRVTWQRLRGECHICRSVGVVWGVNVGIYCIHGVYGVWDTLRCQLVDGID